MIKTLYPVTPAKAEALRAALAFWGANKARVRQMRNGACRVNLATVDHRSAARDAFVELNACTASGQSFTDVKSRFAWNGPTEIFIRFLEP